MWPAAVTVGWVLLDETKEAYVADMDNENPSQTVSTVICDRRPGRDIIPSRGRPTLRCVFLGHRAGFRSPGDPHRWFGLACRRCGDYPVNIEGRYRGPVYTRAAERLRRRLGIPDQNAS